MLTRIVTLLLLLLLVALPVVAGHPTTIGEKDPEGIDGRFWVAASRALRADGSVRYGLGTQVEGHLNFESRHVVADHGLEDGVPAQTDEFCPPSPFIVTTSRGVEETRFDLKLLLSEVAVTAEVRDAIPGFDKYGYPVMLFSLSNVVPLHGRSPVPGYVLVPVDRIVYRGRVFCRPAQRSWRNGDLAPPAVGDRVALIGGWIHGGIISTDRSGGALALIEDEELTWVFPGGYVGEFPGSASALQARVDEAVAGGLFDLTAHLKTQRWSSPERREFVRTWGRLNDNGCRVAAADTREGRTVATRILCRILPEPPQEQEPPQKQEPSQEQEPPQEQGLQAP